MYKQLRKQNIYPQCILLAKLEKGTKKAEGDCIPFQKHIQQRILYENCIERQGDI